MYELFKRFFESIVSYVELEGVVKNVVSYALNRQLSIDGLTKLYEKENIKVKMDEFLNALQEVVPTFKASKRHKYCS